MRGHSSPRQPWSRRLHRGEFIEARSSARCDPEPPAVSPPSPRRVHRGEQGANGALSVSQVSPPSPRRVHRGAWFSWFDFPAKQSRRLHRGEFIEAKPLPSCQPTLQCLAAFTAASSSRLVAYLAVCLLPGVSPPSPRRVHRGLGTGATLRKHTRSRRLHRGELIEAATQRCGNAGTAPVSPPSPRRVHRGPPTSGAPGLMPLSRRLHRGEFIEAARHGQPPLAISKVSPPSPRRVHRGALTVAESYALTVSRRLHRGEFIEATPTRLFTSRGCLSLAAFTAASSSRHGPGRVRCPSGGRLAAFTAASSSRRHQGAGHPVEVVVSPPSPRRVHRGQRVRQLSRMRQQVSRRLHRGEFIEASPVLVEVGIVRVVSPPSPRRVHRGAPDALRERAWAPRLAAFTAASSSRQHRVQRRLQPRASRRLHRGEFIEARLMLSENGPGRRVSPPSPRRVHRGSGPAGQGALMLAVSPPSPRRVHRCWGSFPAPRWQSPPRDGPLSLWRVHRGLPSTLSVDGRVGGPVYRSPVYRSPVSRYLFRDG